MPIVFVFLTSALTLVNRHPVITHQFNPPTVAEVQSAQLAEALAHLRSKKLAEIKPALATTEHP